MERIVYKPAKIKKLESDILSGNKNAVNEFWNYIKVNKNPIIEDIADDKEHKIVTIVYREKKKLENVVLIPPVGMRKLEKCIMDKVEGSDLWYISYRVRKNICFTYEFSYNDPLNNDWERRWKNVQGDEFNNNKIKHIDKANKRERMIPYIMMEDARKFKYIYKNTNVKEGKLFEHKLFSKYLNEERKVNVYVPYDYNKNNQPYNMIVLNDGEQYLKILNTSNVLDNLIYEKKIPHIIAVFIDSDKDRTKNLQCNDEYAAFIGIELMEFLKNNYNVLAESKMNSIGGYSLGGLFAAYMGLKYSHVFGNVISQSGSYWYKPSDYNEENLWICNEFKKSGNPELNFYINVGTIEPQISMKNTNIKFKDYLIKNNYNVKFEEFPSGHDYLYWGETLADALKSIYK